MIDPQKLLLLEQQHGLPQGLLSAVMMAESAGNPNAVSPKGARGLFQFMPPTTEAYGINPDDPEQAASGAARMYADLSKQYGGDLPKMLAGYNWGSGNLQKHGLENAPEETRNYIDKVTSSMGREVKIIPTANEMTVPAGRNIRFPNGKVLKNVPTDLTKEQIQQKLAESGRLEEFGITLPEEDDGFLTRVGQDIQKRRAQAGESVAATQRGEQTKAEEIFQRFSKAGVGTMLDVMGEGAVSGFRALPDVVEQPLRQAGSFVAEQVAPVVQPVVEAYEDFAKNNPRAARNTESAGNLLAMFAPIKGKPALMKQTPFGKVGSKLEKVAATQAKQRKGEFALDLVKPKQTASVREAQVGRTVEEGFKRNKVVAPTPREAEIAKELSRLPIDKGKTLQGNYNVISKEVTKEARRLENRLKRKDVVFPRKEYFAKLNGAMQRLSENPELVGDAAKSAEKIIQKMQSIVQSKKSSASGLLQARKELDAWIRSQKGAAAFDPKYENAMTIAIREIRKTTNDFIDTKATDVGVKSSLRRQSNLFNAMDNIAPKAADEATNRIARLWQNVSNIVPINNDLTRNIVTTLGLGVVGGATALSPLVGGAVAAGYGINKLQKFARSPAAKRGLATLLNQTDRAIRVTKDKQLIQQLRADRAALIEIMRGEDDGYN